MSKTVDDTNLVPRLVVVGDVAFDTSDPRDVLARIAPYTRSSAIAFCNCEWALTDRGQPWPGKAGRVVRSPPRMIDAYSFAGFDVVSLANNHVMNYGPEGLAQTIELLDSARIAHCGAGSNLEAAHAPAIIRHQGLRIAFLSYTSVFTAGFEATDDRPGMATVRIDTTYKVPARLHEMPGSPLDAENRADPADLDRLVANIRKVRREADVVVLAWHWGVSLGYQHLVPYQKKLGRLAIDEGVDLVVGHHPHTIQGVENYKGKTIAYSVPHCGFDMRAWHLSDESLLVEAPLLATGLGEVSFRPLENSLAWPGFSTGDKARSCFEWLQRLSKRLGTTLYLEGDHIRVKPQ